MMKAFALISSAVLLCSCAPSFDGAGVGEVRAYISASWDRTVRHNTDDDGSLIGLPYDYTVPSPEGMFQEMYYWDTFFTNEGLLADGRLDLARGNVDNMLALVERFGYMPNGTRTWYLNRSQPPYLSMMVRSIYERTGDRDWLASACETLLKEYEFWQNERLAPCGLNRYWSSTPDWLVAEMAVTGPSRIGMQCDSLDAVKMRALSCDFIAEAESGWDFNPRFERRCGDFCPIDLNSNLYAYESNFAFFARELSLADEQLWLERAQTRKSLIIKYCYDVRSGLFFDYDYVNGRRGSVLSAAAFSPLFVGLADRSQARRLARRALAGLEYPFGLSVCPEGDYGFNYQWSYPNAWPPTTYIAIDGLRRYGLQRDARRLAVQYVNAICSLYARTGKLWEKYNVTDGSDDVNNEYDMPEMLGWTAGTFIYASEFLSK